MGNRAVIIGKGAKWVGTETLIRWDEYPHAEAEVSLPKIVDDDGKKLRNEYIQWIHCLSLKQFGNRSLIHGLEVFPGISAWWSSELAEKSFWKTPEIYDVLRLRALELYCISSGVEELILCVPNRKIHKVLKKWCEKYGLRYKWQPKSNKKISASSFRAYQKCIKICPLLLYLLEYIVRNFAFINYPKPSTNFTLAPDGLTIFSYSANFDKDKLKSGRYDSSYWRGLPSMLNNQSRNVNWLFRFYRSELCQDARSALKLANTLNQNEYGKHRFFFLEQWLSWGLIVKAVFMHYKLRLKTPIAKSVQNDFRFQGSELNFWPVLRQVWVRSIHGYEALDNVMMLMLFREFIATIPKQKIGICLAEFMGWERSLIQCWHANGFGRILGYIHCFVSFFDFRFFTDKVAYSSNLPRYDKVIVNSKVTWDRLQKNGYPPRELLKAEALTQSYLCNRATNYTERADPEQRRASRLLVLTDYDKDVLLEQLTLLASVLNSAEISKRFLVIIKPHPLLNIDDIVSELFPAGSYKILDLSLSMSEALLQADIVYASNFTSAAIDAAFVNLPLIICLSGAQVNMSPLRGIQGVTFVSDTPQLIEALNNPKSVALPKDFFYLDKDLRLWRDLLKHWSND